MTDMKTRFPIYAALVLISLLASCSKDFTSMDGIDAPLEMKLQPALAPETKASMQTSDLTEFWLQVEDSQDPAYSYFTKVTKSGTDWNPADKMFWKNSSAAVNYCAAFYSGHNFTQEEFTNGVDLTVPADQSTQKKLNSADLLILKSTNTTYQATTNGQLPVELTHGLAKIKIVISLGDAFRDALFSIARNPLKKVTVKEVNIGFNFKPQTGAVTVKAEKKEDIEPHEVNFTPILGEYETATAEYEAILVPQTFAKGELKVTFKIGMGNYEWTNTSAITLEAGKTYNLPISVTSAPPVKTYNGHTYVDMGLSVKWASYNVGATVPSEEGDYFAWGETESYHVSMFPFEWKTGKEKGYDWPSYQWYDSLENTLTKYNATDYKTTLDPDNDAATVKWGGSWRTPTKEEWDELKHNCDIDYIEHYPSSQYPTGGFLLTSNINGNRIFLPQVSILYHMEEKRKFDTFLYWSSSLHTNQYEAWCTDVRFVSQTTIERCYGLHVRPVCP